MLFAIKHSKNENLVVSLYALAVVSIIRCVRVARTMQRGKRSGIKKNFFCFNYRPLNNEVSSELEN
jgi:hypothetical protein